MLELACALFLLAGFWRARGGSYQGGPPGRTRSRRHRSEPRRRWRRPASTAMTLGGRLEAARLR
uniref:Uncharacterized protein n=1 Tax=Arundo donax TaxID=35708 RepID=A0A0A9B0H5_ARUDO